MLIVTALTSVNNDGSDDDDRTVLYTSPARTLPQLHFSSQKGI